MYLTMKQQLHLTKQEYLILKELCHISKNLVNESLYNIRQHFFNTNKYLEYEDNYKLLKTSENYKLLNSNIAQQIIKRVHNNFSSFFALLKLKNQGNYKNKVNIPRYLDKDGFNNLIIQFIRIKNNVLILPFSNAYKKQHTPIQIQIQVPKPLQSKVIKQIEIIPKLNANYFEIYYTYENDKVYNYNLNPDKAMGIDLGINNLCTCATNTGESFIIDGKRLKSINQYYNKQNAKLQSIKDKQKKTTITKKQAQITQKRNNQINDYISKTARKIINYCISNNIGTIVIGYNKDFQNKTNLGRKTNQMFISIPFGKLINKLKYLCDLYNIQLILQEESYTSKSSFWDKDILPIYNPNNTTKYKFSGKRVHRGLYKTKNNKMLNADINGALNILRKSKVVGLNALYCRGDLDTPLRIRVA